MFNHKAYSKEHYLKNRQKYIDKARRWNGKFRTEARDLINQLKDKPCADCGNKFPPCVMDFHHRDRGTKIDSVARLIGTVRSLTKIREEIDKCDLICANCHRIRSYNQLSPLGGTGYTPVLETGPQG